MLWLFCYVVGELPCQTSTDEQPADFVNLLLVNSDGGHVVPLEFVSYSVTSYTLPSLPMQKLYNITVLHHILFALGADSAQLARFTPRAGLEQFLPVNNLGP